MLYFEEEETNNEQSSLSVLSGKCFSRNVLNFVLILYFSSIRGDVGMREFRNVL